MVDIDERVVSMKFDSNDFEQKSKSTLSILDKIHEKLSFKDAANSDSLNSVADNVQKIADKAYTIVDRMIDKIKDNIANKLVNFLQENTIGQIKSGFDKYADMTTSVATLKSQGYELDKITEQLEKLNFYTDETSYSFTDMVREIGKFTASGQSLDNATEAMMGIANWAALSGKNAGEASRAMYQLSQALGAGKIRKEDWKSIQNLNMDTKEFRENAIQAAIEFGTLKETAEGTYTSLVGKKANKLSFSVQQFAENLTEGEWFTADVMMQVFNQYSEAVDEIYDLYNEANENSDTEVTASTIIRNVKDNNKKLIKEFEKTGLSTKDINKVLASWKKVEKVTDETVNNYSDIHKMSKDQAFKEMSSNYENYLSEYTKLFTGSEKDAEEALDRWQSYVSEFGLKALSAAQEARTFSDAIESAKDAASSVWVGVYTNIFGNYEEAKELWTDLANALYDIFVARLWKISDIFTYWKTGYEEDWKAEIAILEQEYNNLIEKEKSGGLIQGERDRLRELKAEIDSLTSDVESGLLNGRRVLFQGLYAFGSGLKSILENFRDAWDSTFDENESAKKLFKFSEKIRYDGFRFYTMMQELGETDFYKNIAEGIKNIFAPFKGAIEVIKSVINAFLPAKKTTKDMLLTLSEAFKNFTEKLVPSQETLQKIAKILRGVVSVIRLLAKAAYGLWITIIKPIANVILGVLGEIFDLVTDVLANMADGFFGFEAGLEPLDALQLVVEALNAAFDKLGDVIKAVAGFLWELLGPAVSFVIGIFRDLFVSIKKLFTGGKGNVLENVANGFKNVTARAKAAWKSTESFADVFKRFRAGTGAGNFIELLGELLDNLVTRIGRTIVALFGLEEVMNDGNSNIGKSFKTLKGTLTNIATVIMWIYTNILRPTLNTLFVGFANILRDVGDAWREGDVMKILDIITRSFKALGALQLFKVLQILSRTFGSAGILKVLRNGAKALKSLSKWLGAKALNETSSAIFKLVVGFSLLLGVLTAMSFLPTENLEKVSSLLIHAGIALGVMMIAMTTLSIVATKTRWGLVGIAGSMVAIVAATWTFIFVIEKIRQAVERFQEETEGFGGVIVAIAPILGVLAAMFIVFKAAAKIGNSGGLLAFGVGVMSLGVAVFAMIFALNKMVSFIQENNADDIISAILATVAIMSAVALSSGLMLKIVGSSFGNIAKSASALTVAVSIVTMALTTALIVIPLLENMIQNADKFPLYMEALAILALTMISMSASFALMTSRTKGGLHMLAAGITFKMFASTLNNFIIPMLESIKDLHLETYLSGILSVGTLIFVISISAKKIFEGIATIITSLSRINAKTWLSIILSTGAVIGGVLLLVHFLEDTKSEISVSAVIVAIGVVLAVILAFSIFATMLIKSVGNNASSLDSLSKVFKWMTLLIATIMVGLTGTMIAITSMNDVDQQNKAIAILALFAGIILVELGLTFQIIGAWIKKINTYLSAIGGSTISKTIGIMVAVFAGIISLMLTLTGMTIALGSVFDDLEDYVGPLVTIVGGTLILLALGLGAISLFLNFIPTLAFNKHACIVLIASLASIILLILTVSTALLPAFDKYASRADWKNILALLSGLTLIILAVGALVGISSLSNAENVLKGVAGAFLALLGIAVIIPVLANAFRTFETVSFGDVIVGLIAVLAPLAAVYVLVDKFGSNGFGDKFFAAALKISGAIIMISLALGTLALAIAAVIELFNPGSTWLSMGLNIMQGATEGVIEGKDQYVRAIGETAKAGNKEFKKETKENSPSKLYKQYGKYIDVGLAQGITKNKNVAIKAASGLAIFTNEGFCEELGIASPSKVFYENGRFVVRGFINGLNDESAKHKEAGEEMASGFAEGMDDMMDNMKDKWSGLWSDLGMDEDIKKAIEDGTEGTGSLFANNLLDELTGENSTIVSQLSDAEAQQLSELKETQKERDNAIKELERSWTGAHDDSFAAAKQQLANKYGKDLDAQIDALESKAGKSVKKNNKLTTLFSSVFGDAFTGLGENANFVDKLKGFGGTIADGIGDVFSKDGSGFNSLKETGKTLLEELGLDFGGNGSNTSGTPAENIGNQVGNAIGNGLSDFLGGDTFRKTLDGVGNNIGNSLKNGIDSVLNKYNPFANIKLMYDTLMNEIERKDKIEENIDDASVNVYDYEKKLKLLREQKSTIEDMVVNDSRSAEYKSKQLNYINSEIKRYEDLMNNYTSLINFYKAQEDDSTNYKSVGDLFYKSFGDKNVDSIFGSKDLGDMFESQGFKDMMHNNKANATWLFREFRNLTDANTDLIDSIDETTGIMYLTQKGSDTLLTLWKLMNNDEFVKGNKLNGTSGYSFVDFNINEWLKHYESQWPAVAENDVDGYNDSFGSNWKDKVVKTVTGSYDDMIKDVQDESEQNSPSRLWARIASYDVEGYIRGFEETFPGALSMVSKNITLLNDTAKIGMQAMVNTLNEDIEPSITPIFDGIDTKSSIGSINNAISGITPTIQATVDSFRDETPNYNSKFDALANNINNTNTLMNTLLSMLEEGDIVNINVTTEADTNNIYDTVVNVNRQKFRQTGKNLLMI